MICCNGCFSPGETVRPRSQCEQHRDSLQSGVDLSGQPSVGAFIPQCDSDGRYRQLQVSTDSQSARPTQGLSKKHADSDSVHYLFQCHGSTGHCWCVDIRGQERGGTRTPPGTAPRDCDRPGINSSLSYTWVFHLKMVYMFKCSRVLSPQMNQSVLKLTVSTTETGSRPPVQRGTP